MTATLSLLVGMAYAPPAGGRLAWFAAGLGLGIALAGAWAWWQARRRRRAGSVEALADAARQQKQRSP